MNRLKTTLLLSLLTIMMVMMGSVIGGKTGMVFAFFMAAAMNFFSYWFSDKIVLKMYGAQEIGEHDHPAFYGMVRHLAQRAGLPMPKVYIIHDQSPNAFATGRNPQHAAVAATEGIFRILTPDELEGVMAHELAHVRGGQVVQISGSFTRVSAGVVRSVPILAAGIASVFAVSGSINELTGC